MEPQHVTDQNIETQKSSTKGLADKVAVITGGARGIGAAAAKLFAEIGAHVVIADVLDDLGTTMAESIGGRYIHCNVSKEDDVESAINLALSWKGNLDIMLSNAGIEGPKGSVTTLDMDQVRHLFSINLHGINHAARAMIKAIDGLVRSGTCELGEHWIRVNCISPHGVPSEMLLSACRRFAHGHINPQGLKELIGSRAILL
ncbi:Short-chain dehydrogenase reductase ATA1 [Glycine max]|uniref:Sex determination protein tasselseed-2 n=1 Tax=Glycine soja TaxID=3848 RepID=A0A0B2PYS6_GLYSO|nr:Short-chain dehydrogenase reductase ATA1 [Glycine max]KHN14466.1 Sex determination protein tasselseed-2 [Glycine soja]